LIPLLVMWHLPCELSNKSLSEETAGEYISSGEVSWSIRVLANLPTPHETWVWQLDRFLHTRWSSVQLTRIQNPTTPKVFLPLWAITYWNRLKTAGVKQRNGIMCCSGCWATQNIRYATQPLTSLAVPHGQASCG
jgi:hypothetical protein